MVFRFKRDSITAIYGKRESGKTTLTRFFVHEEDFEDTTVYDGVGNFHPQRDFVGCQNVTVIKRPFTSPEWDKFNDRKVWQGRYCVIDEFDMVNLYHRNFYREWINTSGNIDKNGSGDARVTGTGGGGIVCARRPTMIPPDVRANADWSIIFLAKETTVQKYLKESFTDEVVQVAGLLEPHQFIVVNPAGDIEAKCILTPDGKKLHILE